MELGFAIGLAVLTYLLGFFVGKSETQEQRDASGRAKGNGHS